MTRDRAEDIGSLILASFLGGVLVYSLRNYQPAGALPFLLAFVFRDFIKRRRSTGNQPPPPPTVSSRE